MSETSKVLQIGTIFHEVCEDVFLSALSEDNRVKVALSLFIQANDKRGNWPRKAGNGAPAPAQGEQTYTGLLEARKVEDYQTRDGKATKKYTFKVGEKTFVAYGGFGQKLAESTREFRKNDRVTAVFSVEERGPSLKSISKADAESADDLEQQPDDISF